MGASSALGPLSLEEPCRTLEQPSAQVMGHSQADPAREVIAQDPPSSPRAWQFPVCGGIMGDCERGDGQMSEPERKTLPRKGAGGRAVHDIGGLTLGPIDRSEHDLALWEKRTDAML